MEKNNEQKTYTYIVLVAGLLIWIFYFYHGKNDFLTTRYSRTEYSRFFDWSVNGLDIFDWDFAWLLLQVLFLYSWWNLRNCIVSVLKKIHRKV